MAHLPEEIKNEAAFAREAERRGIKVKNEDDKPIEIYLEDNFQSYVEERYAVADKNLLKNPTIL